MDARDLLACGGGTGGRAEVRWWRGKGDQPEATACYVGGLPLATQKHRGCIAVAASSGTASTFTIDSTTFTATCANKNWRTFKWFSTQAEGKMYNCARDASKA